MRYDDGETANVEVRICPEGDHVVVTSEDGDGEVTSIGYPPAVALYLSAAYRFAALRVIAKTAPS